MQGMIRCVVVAGLVSACHSDDTAVPDAPVTGTTAMTVQWATEPGSWPGVIHDGITIDSARFAFDSLRVIGDAGPGDLRTTARTFEVRWEKDRDPPAAIEFADAPAGLYSQVALQVDGHLVNNSYEIRGTIQIDGNDVEYRIEDDAALPVTLAIDKMKSPSAAVRLEIDIDFVHAIDSIDFSKLMNDSGHLELDSSSVGIVEFRKKLVESFSAGSIDG
jgi:hypothetical protein